MTRKSILLALASLLAAALCLLAGCPAPGAQDSAAADPDAAGRAIPTTVYVAGRCRDSMLNSTACYWNGTSRVDLNGQIATAVYVSAGTVYTAGVYNAGGYTQPCFWKGTSRINLPAGGTHGYAYSIFVTGGNVSVAGYFESGGYERPCIWYYSDGSIMWTDLPIPADRDGYAQSVYVDGSISYAAGWYYNSTLQSIARLWTFLPESGTRPVDLSTDYSVANSVFAYGGYVYIGGYYKAGAVNVACVWKWQGDSSRQTVSLTRTDLSGTDGRVNSLMVYNGKIIAAGSVGQRSCYWVNGHRYDVSPDISSTIFSFCIADAKVTTAGCYFDGYRTHACAWTGRLRTDLPDKGYSSMALGIF